MTGIALVLIGAAVMMVSPFERLLGHRRAVRRNGAGALIDR